ncbi:DUF2478 domain-containing protein [Bradyrhizobium sp.]|uniref:DUF2478 domain-containing protein n=1 Tax=Bradyrhizobium sp. TaxID=376 RepID=UPI00239F94E1|nr:DUF2478 domain-containing protein [Bradyrhizobium sp.]MDE2378785.1 DUF2478 domain-containing protein [Bradyrhizobium sp.]
MSVAPSELSEELSSGQIRSVAAIVYPDEAYPGALFQALVDRWRAAGLAVAGVVQHQVFEKTDQPCNVLLEDLTSGHRTVLFENRGSGAAGCRLDQAALADATARVEGSLARAPDVLVLNKFGKAECQGGGLRDLVAGAIGRGIPVVIGVPRQGLDVWRGFAGGLATELPPDPDAVERWLQHLR